MIDQDIALRWLTAIAAVGAWIYAWWTRQDDKTEKKIASLETDVNLVSSRLVKIETQLADMPSKEDYHKTDITLTEIKGQLATLNERIKPIGAISDRLQEFLLNQAAGPKTRARPGARE